jgi:hypothetical protein
MIQILFFTFSALAQSGSVAECDFRYNPDFGSCRHYRTYSAGIAVSDCLPSFSQSLRHLRELQLRGICSRPVNPPACLLRSNPPDDFCRGYIVYAADHAVSECVSNFLTAEQMIGGLRADGVCY